MYDKTYQKINSTETIISSIPKIIEAFVTYYGESERENIENKFKNMLVIGYSSPKEIMRLIRDDKKQKSDELINSLLNKLNIPEDKKQEVLKIYFDNNELEYQSLHPIYRYYIQCLNKNNYRNKETVEFLSKIYPQITMDNIDEFIKSNSLVEINNFAKEYEEILKQYNEYKKIFKPYEKYDEKCTEYKRNLEKKYTGLYIDAFKYLFTEEEYNKIKETLENSRIFSIQGINKKTESYLGWASFYGKALIDAFNEESNQILVDGSDWRKESIIKDRIKFFKNLNIDLGDNYEDYKNHKDVEKLFEPLKDLAEKMLKKRQELYDEMMNKYYQSLDEYQKNQKRIEAEELLDKNHGYNANAYENNATFVSTNIKKTENGYIMYPMLCYSIEGLREYLDARLIHELNHVYESSLQNADETHYCVTCGWEIYDEKLDEPIEYTVSLEKNQEKRNYELFNEIVNELISQEITEILFSSNGYIFNDKEDAKIKGGTSYESTMFIVRDFYNTYKKEIIESRRNGDMSHLFEVVGKENFESLNELFHIFYKEFSGANYYSLMNDLIEKKETENTKKYFEIRKKAKEIFEAMQEHSKNNGRSL